MSKLRGYLEQPDAKLWAALLASLLFQTAYWYLGSPGPTLLGDAGQTVRDALANIGWALVWLLGAPLLTLRLLGVWLEGLSFGLGDVRFGLVSVLGFGVLFIPFLYLGAANADLQAVYPWAGAWVGRTVLNVVAWTLLYSLYYLSFEFFYRGFLLRLLAAPWGLPAAVGMQLVASVLIHLGKPLPEVIAAIPAGLVFALLALRGRSLLYPVLLHLLIGITTDLAALHHQGLLL